jgi:quinol monooxygenase YgiN
MPMAVVSAIALCGSPLSSWAADEAQTIESIIHASPGREAEAAARLLKLRDFVRKAEPSITYNFYQSKKDPTLFMTYEVYPNAAELSEHNNVVLPAFRKEAGPASEGLYTRPTEINELQELSN